MCARWCQRDRACPRSPAPVQGACRRGAARLVLALGLALTLPAISCRNYEDCDLYGTCAGDLIERFGEEKGDACERCLTDRCRHVEDECATDLACNYAVRCTLAANPVAYQDCLAGLRERGYASAADERPWEGRGGGFAACVSQCREDCSRPAWSCAYDSASGSRTRFRLELAIRNLAGAPVGSATVRFCSELEHDCEGASVPSSITDAQGGATLEVAPGLVGWHLEISPGSSEEFPPTIYYPGQLGTSDVQPLAVYLVSAPLVEEYSRQLSSAEPDPARPRLALWPESCNRVTTKLAHDVSFRLSGAELPPCAAAAPGTPCAWYLAEDGTPGTGLHATRDQGGGIAGLSEGRHVIEGCGPGATLLARRTVLLKRGWLTIARLWPLTESERAPAGGAGCHSAP